MNLSTNLAWGRMPMRSVQNVSLFLLLVCLNQTLSAQMFGNRAVGQPLDRRNPLAESELLSGVERFLRDNRDPRQFIGRDTTEAGFVGMVGASQPLNLAPQLPLVTAAPDRSAILNRPMDIRRPNSLLPPRFAIGFDSSVRTNVELAGKTQASLNQLLNDRFGNRFEVLVEGPTATLLGVAHDVEQRQLVEMLILMEPGIAEVKNQTAMHGELLPIPATKNPD